jgi:SAM-dependent methyltransferase
VTDPPFPPLQLADRVLSLQGEADPYAAYAARGAETKAALLELLPYGWSFAGKRVLDFGCGAGRTLRHFLAEAETAKIWGADIDADSIEWLQRSLCPPLHAVRCGVSPPLPLEPGFDLVWAISVFTHLTDTSLPWLLELHRVLKPGGLLVATYMGRWNSEILAGEPWDEDRIGMNVLRHDQGWDDGGPMVLMSDWWVREHWGRAFDVLSTADVHGQTWALLRRREVSLTVAELEAPADDPREWAALRHNLRQVQRELEVRTDEVRRFYEGSRSWRLTRPLRRLSRS